MTTELRQLEPHERVAGARPLVLLDVPLRHLEMLSPAEVESDIGTSEVVAVRVASGAEFVLESPRGGEPETTAVYGADAEPLDELLAALGLDWRNVRDRAYSGESAPVVRSDDLALKVEGLTTQLELLATLLAQSWEKAAEADRRSRIVAALEVGELTERERDAIALSVSGMEVDRIADRLGVQPATVKKYRRSAMKRLDYEIDWVPTATHKRTVIQLSDLMETLGDEPAVDLVPPPRRSAKSRST